MASIRDLIRRRKERRAERKAPKPVPTKTFTPTPSEGGVSQRTEFERVYKAPTPDPTPTRTGGNGGGGGSKTPTPTPIRTGGTPTQTLAPTKTPIKTARDRTTTSIRTEKVSQVKARQETQRRELERRKRQDLFKKQQEEKRREKESPTKIKVLKSGGVKVGGITYVGESIVPFSGGKTANQIRAETFKEARKQGIKKKGSYTATIGIEKEEIKPSPSKEIKVSTQSVLLMGVEGKVKPLETRSVIDVATKRDMLKGEEFRKEGKVRIERFGTVTEQLPRVEEKTLKQLREETIILGGGSSSLFMQEAPRKAGSGIIEFVPIVGQVKPTVKALRELSEEQRKLVGTESILGAGAASQKGVRKSIVKSSFQVGLLALDVAATGATVKVGAKALGAEARAVRGLRKAQPELFLGVEKVGEEGSVLVIRAKRKVGKLESDVLTKFDVTRVGEKSVQIERGRGIQQISKEGKLIKRTEFTLFGEAEELPIKVIKRKPGIERAREIKEPTKGIFSEVKVLTVGEQPELIKSFGVGVQETTGDITKVISFPAKKKIRVKTGEGKLIDLSAKKVSPEDIFGTPKVRVRAEEFDSIGVIKKVPSRTEPGVIDISGGRLQTIQRLEEKVGGAVGQQLEVSLLKAPTIKATPIVKPLAISRTKDIKVTVQAPRQVSVSPQAVMIQEKKVVVQPQVGAFAKQEFKLGLIVEPIKKTKTRTRQRAVQVSILKQEVKVAPSQAQIFKQAQVQMQSQAKAQAKAQIKVQQLLGLQAQKAPSRVVSVPTPIPKVKVKPKPTPAKDFIQSIRAGEFTVFEKIKGKDVETGVAFDLGKAAKKLKKGLKKGVQASGFIIEKKTGKKIKAAELIPFLGEEFRVSKVSASRVVQRKTRRLGTGRETTEIQFFRKQKGGFF